MPKRSNTCDFGPKNSFFTVQIPFKTCPEMHDACHARDEFARDCLLQRTVRLSREVTRRGREARLFARVCGTWGTVR